MDLQAICAVCDELVDALTVSLHMDGHGLLLPSDWQLRRWPDGGAVVIDPTTAPPSPASPGT